MDGSPLLRKRSYTSSRLSINKRERNNVVSSPKTSIQSKSKQLESPVAPRLREMIPSPCTTPTNKAHHNNDGSPTPSQSTCWSPTAYLSQETSIGDVGYVWDRQTIEASKTKLPKQKEKVKAIAAGAGPHMQKSWRVKQKPHRSTQQGIEPKGYDILCQFYQAIEKKTHKIDFGGKSNCTVELVSSKENKSCECPKPYPVSSSDVANSKVEITENKTSSLKSSGYLTLTNNNDVNYDFFDDSFDIDCVQKSDTPLKPNISSKVSSIESNKPSSIPASIPTPIPTPIPTSVPKTKYSNDVIELLDDSDSDCIQASQQIETIVQSHSISVSVPIAQVGNLMQESVNSFFHDSFDDTLMNLLETSITRSPNVAEASKRQSFSRYNSLPIKSPVKAQNKSTNFKKCPSSSSIVTISSESSSSSGGCLTDEDRDNLRNIIAQKKAAAKERLAASRLLRKSQQNSQQK